MSNDDRRTRKLTRQIESFAGRHGGARGQVAYLGEPGARLVLVGADGTWGDLVAPSMRSATAAAEAAGVALQEDFDGDLAAGVRTGPYEWTRMAGIQVGGQANPAAPGSEPEAEPAAVGEEATASGGGAEQSEPSAPEPAQSAGEAGTDAAGSTEGGGVKSGDGLAVGARGDAGAGSAEDGGEKGS
ncbi:hypothetical protein DMB38_05835 [Streptomyces sp. WAC 06738]|uniref:hypothetical protein n=1 Tax=Streptomyces sp. WAC 06738 TaxID=2203210 RepID=UPI000F6B897C|nr:hypothetical protein DMB38_05835 [Streptomyces sp. WAC 06738]